MRFLRFLWPWWGAPSITEPPEIADRIPVRATYDPSMLVRGRYSPAVAISGSYEVVHVKGRTSS